MIIKDIYYKNQRTIINQVYVNEEKNTMPRESHEPINEKIMYLFFNIIDHIN